MSYPNRTFVNFYLELPRTNLFESFRISRNYSYLKKITLRSKYFFFTRNYFPLLLPFKYTITVSSPKFSSSVFFPALQNCPIQWNRIPSTFFNSFQYTFLYFISRALSILKTLKVLKTTKKWLLNVFNTYAENLDVNAFFLLYIWKCSRVKLLPCACPMSSLHGVGFCCFNNIVLEPDP